ncbi:TolC family protein [Bombella saccharophila]|uniref:TolC family protein n=1 Tax=Bombella saccharophila TaxID=2967338 RepID=A0ABT3W4A3_9PROT|nr:TolC family protein [Bombella saccharophila]MCX5613857.1 TolC family protein [Bombella saccharophila]
MMGRDWEKRMRHNKGQKAQSWPAVSSCQYSAPGGRWRKAVWLCAWLVGSTALSGCQTGAMKDAPTAPDRPWAQRTNVQGHLLAGGEEAPHAERGTRGLRMPEGFRLAADHSMPQAPALASVQVDHAYNLADLIDVAQSLNPSTRMAWDAARQSAAETGIARSQYLPHLTASAMGGYAVLEPHNRIRGDASANSNTKIHGTLERQQVGLEWLLFDFGKRRATMEEASQISLGKNILFTGEHQKVIHQVALAYYRYSAALNNVALVKQSLENAHEISRAAAANLRNGEGTVVDTSQAEQAVAEAELVLARTEGDVETYRLELLTAVGMNPSQPLHVQTDNKRDIKVDDIRLSDEMVHQAVSRRPDVLAAYTSLRAAQSAVEGARASYRPQIFMNGNVGYNFDDLHFRNLPLGTVSSLNDRIHTFGSLITAGISVPIYDGGLRRNRLRQAHEREDSARAALQDAQNNAVRTIVSAEAMLHTGITAYQAALSLQKASQTGFDAALTAYRSGDGTMTRMLELQNTLLNARLSVSDSYYGMLSAAASLAYAAGTLGSSAALTDIEGSLAETAPEPVPIAPQNP